MDLKKLVAQFNSAKAAAGNGAAGLHVVKPVEHMLLNTALSKISELEGLLTAARSDAKQAAKRAGVSISGLFSTTKFIARSTGERWADEGIEEGKAQLTAVILAAAKATRDPNPVYVRAGAALREALMSGAFASFYDEAAVDPDHVAKTAAAAIVEAAAKRDAGGTVPFAKPGPAAQRILDSGRKRRQGMGDDK